MARTKVAVALSGGKDSTAAVLLLQKQGHEVVALTMTLGIKGDGERIDRLKHLCASLHVPLQVVDFSGHFDRFVRHPFAAAYLADKTPNPCALCNREIKFGRFMDEMLRISGADLMATGHYAAVCIRDQKRFLCEPVEKRKSQIYFLALMEPKRLEKVVFPLSTVTVDEVRAMTRDLPLVNKQESQDVCFLAGSSLHEYLARELDMHAFRPGEIVDLKGNVLGRHQGLIHYTVGQRRGLRYAGGKRLYVVAKDSVRNRLVLAEEGALLSRRLRGVMAVYWRELHAGDVVTVKIRYQAEARAARVLSCSTEEFDLHFEEPVGAVTPGQIAVLYDGELIVAGAEIGY